MSDQLTPVARRGARCPAILVLAVAVLVTAAPGSAGVGRWTRIGPDGGLTWSPLPGSAGAPEMTNLQNLGDGRLLAGSSNSGVLEYREVAEAPGRPAAAN